MKSKTAGKHSRLSNSKNKSISKIGNPGESLQEKVGGKTNKSDN